MDCKPISDSRCSSARVELGTAFGVGPYAIHIFFTLANECGLSGDDERECFAVVVVVLGILIALRIWRHWRPFRVEQLGEQIERTARCANRDRRPLADQERPNSPEVHWVFVNAWTGKSYVGEEPVRL